MKGSMRIMSKTNRTNQGRGEVGAAMEETLGLYHAWLGYLLTRQGEETLRVEVEDIRSALDRFSCTVERDGDAYVIRLATRKEAAHG